MKLPFFKPRQERVRLQAAEPAETREPLRNPARGWYQIHTFLVDREPDLEELTWCLNPEDALVFLLFDIGGYRDRNLDQEALGRMARVLEFVARRNYDCIVRAVYDHEGRAPEREPFFFAQVLAHLEQVAGVLKPFSCVFVYQGMLVGSWGEMHSSRFLSRERLGRMAEVLRNGRGEETWLAVRRPVQWRQLHKEGTDPLGSAHMGLFDDGMFGSRDHLGTFGTKGRAYTSWDSPWSREDELDFLDALCRQAPYGGEAVWSGEEPVEAGDVLAVLRKTGVTYLNRTHDLRLLDLWKSWRCPLQGIWGEASLYDYVGAHLGYRLVIRGGRVKADRRAGGCCRLEVEVENTGFASVYQAFRVVLAYPDGTEASACQPTPWQSGEVRNLVWEIPPVEGELWLSAARDRDGARLYFANVADEAGRVLLGRLYREGGESGLERSGHRR